MARLSSINRGEIIVVDTSYLLELFRVPGRSNQESHACIRGRIGEAIARRSRLYVPVPVLFELANFVAQVEDGRQRKELAELFSKTIRTSIEESIPFIVTPAGDREILQELGAILVLSDTFSKQFAQSQIGLTDVSIIDQARRLKQKYHTFSVHIWTKDRGLKAYEPDEEKAPYLG